MNDDDEKPDENTPGTKGDSDAKDRPPAVPAEDDDSPLGDTDQHSSADA